MRAWLAILLFVVTTGASAHQFQTLAVSLEELAGYRVAVVLKITEGRNAQAAPVVPRLAPSCETLGQVNSQKVDDLILKSWQLQCDTSLATHRLTVLGLGPAVPDAVVTVRYADGSTRTEVLDRHSPTLSLGEASQVLAVTTLFAYLPIGIMHILGGADHLLFVLCLMLVIAAMQFSWSRLLITITAFTLAHSVTLLMSTLYGLRLSAPAVEAVIALSILLLAVELARSQRAPDLKPGLSLRFPATVAFLFGLLHGLGFAGALAQIGLPEGSAVWALLLFNLGVEAGQILFVVAVLGLVAAVRRLFQTPPAALAPSLVTVTGAMSAYWFIDRLTPILLS